MMAKLACISLLRWHLLGGAIRLALSFAFVGLFVVRQSSCETHDGGHVYRASSSALATASRHQNIQDPGGFGDRPPISWDPISGSQHV